MLAQRGAEGLPPGVISERLKLPLPTLSFHLNDLKHSGLVVSRRESKSVLYEAKVSTVDKVVEYLSENCRGRAKAANLAQRPKVKTSERQMKILFLCTRNSARSIMAECAMSRLGEGRFQAFSAGSDPAANVHPTTLRVLRELNYETNALRSKSWNEFRGGPRLAA